MCVYVRTGFIASHIVYQLLKKGYHVRGTVRDLTERERERERESERDRERDRERETDRHGCVCDSIEFDVSVRI